MRRVNKILTIFVIATLYAKLSMAGTFMWEVHAQEEDDEKAAVLQEIPEKAETEECREDTAKEEKDLPTENSQDIPDLKEDEPTNCNEEMIIESYDNKALETSVNIYYVDDGYKDKISMPPEYKSTYQVVLPDEISGEVQYEVYGDSVKVDGNGMISPEIIIWYHSPSGYWTTQYIEGVETRKEYASGESTVIVVCGAYTQSITVHVISYIEIYVSNTLDKIYNDITSEKSLTEAELARAFTQYAGEHYSYSASYSSLTGIIMNGAGDCWANTAFINALCEKRELKPEADMRQMIPAPDQGIETVSLKQMGNII